MSGADPATDGRRAPRSRRYRFTTRTRASAIAAIGGAALVALLFAVPFIAGRALIQDLFFVLTMLCLAQYWNLLAGFAGLVSVGQQAFVGLGAYGLFALLDPVRHRSAAGHPAGRAWHGARRAADRLRRVPPARPLFRHRHLGGGRSVPAAAGAVQVARRRHRHVAAEGRDQRILRRRAGRRLARPAQRRRARHRRLLAGAGARRRSPSC